MRPAHVCRDGRVICSVEGCGEVLGRLLLHPLYEAVTLELARHFVFDTTIKAWRPPRRYLRGLPPFRRMPRHLRAPGRSNLGYDPSQDLLSVPLPARRLADQPLPTIVFCSRNHQSLLSPESLPIGAWFDAAGQLHRRG